MKEGINVKTNRQMIENIYIFMDDLIKRVHSLEVKNDSDELHERLNVKDHQEKINFACNKADELANGWKGLDIDNLPERFFTRDDIGLERYCDIAGWGEVCYSKNYRIRIIEQLKEGLKYRYILQPSKPLESIEVTKVAMQKDGNILVTRKDGEDLLLIIEKIEYMKI